MPTPAHPVASPHATPDPTLATPPPSQQLPGGGQSGIVHAAKPPPPPPDDPVPVVTHLVRTQHERAAATVVLGPISLPRLLVWADRGQAPAESLWPAYRLVDMHAPHGSSADPRMAAFGALWRSTVHDLVERLMRHSPGSEPASLASTRLGAGE